MPDGAVLIVLLAGMRIAGVRRARVTAELHQIGAPPVRGDEPARVIRGGADFLRYGSARIEGERFIFETPGLSGSLRYAARFPPATVRAPLLERGRATLTWEIEVPDADVTGELHWPGGTLEVAGRGYRDRVWTDILPWRLPMRTVKWGRAAAGPHAATWLQASTDAESVRIGWQDGAVAPGDAPELRETRTLFSTRVADMESLRLGMLGRFLRRMTDPLQTRYLSRTSVNGADGWAAHEDVLWR